MFTIDDKKNPNCTLFFYSELENYFFVYNRNRDLEPTKNGTEFSNGDKIYANIYLNNTKNVNITIKNLKEDENGEEEDESKNKMNIFFRGRKNSSLSTTGIVLISVLIPLGLIVIVIAMIALYRKAAPLANIGENPNIVDSSQNLKN